MNPPSSTIQATAIAGCLVATALLVLKAKWPTLYEMIPPDYQAHLVVGVAAIVGYFKKEKVLI